MRANKRHVDPVPVREYLSSIQGLPLLGFNRGGIVLGLELGTEKRGDSKPETPRYSPVRGASGAEGWRGGLGRGEPVIR